MKLLQKDKKVENILTMCPDCSHVIHAKKHEGWESAYCPNCGLKGYDLLKETTRE